MGNIFKNAYFGKQYKTRDGRKAIYNYHSIGGYHDIIIDDEGMSYHYADHTNGIINLPIPEKCKIDVDYSSPVDIVSEWKEEINEKKLTLLAIKDIDEMILTEEEITATKLWKAGYRKAKEE